MIKRLFSLFIVLFLITPCYGESLRGPSKHKIDTTVVYIKKINDQQVIIDVVEVKRNKIADANPNNRNNNVKRNHSKRIIYVRR